LPSKFAIEASASHTYIFCRISGRKSNPF